MVPSVKANGKKAIVFSYQPNAEPIQLPCSQCIGCRLERSRKWAARCYHESQLHKENCFVTLTYSDEHLPSDHSLHKRHYQLWLKKLRNRFPDSKIRYFLCGEYGSDENTKRPHFHACLFGIDFPDKIIWKSSGENTLYMSKILDETWNRGISTIGKLTFASAAYTARYCMKKVTGEAAEDHYKWYDESGKEHILEPEFIAMSRKPGIGYEWYKKYKDDLFPSDNMVINGKGSKPSKYYDMLHERYFPEEMEVIKQKRNEDRALKPVDEYLDKRLASKEICAKSKNNLYSRRTL